MEKKEEEKWMMPDDFKVVETNKPEEIFNKYLAETVIKTWNTDYKDEVTGKITTVERKEVLFDRGMYIDENLFQKIMFSIQAEEIATVKVCEHKPSIKRINAQVRRYIVKLSDGLHSCSVYATRCMTPEDAAQMVSDYNTVYGLPDIKGNFSILDSSATSLKMIYKEDVNEGYWNELYNISHETIEYKVRNQHKVLPPPYQKDRFFKVSIAHWFEGEDRYERRPYVYMIPALTIMDAARLVLSYVGDDDERIYDITSIGKAPVEYAIPQSYAAAWCDKKYGVGNY